MCPTIILNRERWKIKIKEIVLTFIMNTKMIKSIVVCHYFRIEIQIIKLILTLILDILFLSKFTNENVLQENKLDE